MTDTSYAHQAHEAWHETPGLPATRTTPNGRTPERSLPEWRARLGHYDAVATRSRKGRTSFRVTARRPRHMTGLDHDREVTSASNYDVTRWADDYVRYQVALAIGSGYVNEARDIAATFVPLAGTDAMSWEQVTRGDQSSVDSHGVARHRADIAGGIYNGREPIVRTIRGRRADGTPYVMTDAGTFGDAYTDRRIVPTHVAKHAPRYRLRLPRGVKRSATTRATMVVGPLDTLGAPVHDVPEWVDATHSRLIAPSATTGKVWHGHSLVDASASAVKARTGNEARDDRRTEARAEWAPIADAIAPHIGTAGSFDANGVTVTLTTPGATGRFRATLTYLDGTKRTLQARSAAPIARAVMA